jgi:hypothetical protein
MGLMAKSEGSGNDWEPVPTGTHLARCVTVCDLGLQSTGYGTKEKVFFGFEVPGVRVKWEKDGKEHEGPALLSSTYTLSIHPKSILGQHLVSWRGQEFTDEERDGFDVFKVLGAPCMISVIHNTKGDKTYANIGAIMRVPAGTAVPEAETETIGYTATDGAWSGNLDKLPEWLKKKALEGQRQAPTEPQAAPMPPVNQQGKVGYSTMPDGRPSNGPGSDFDDDIPF